ncbi:hypothetical protein RINTHM_9470 [Richelia intracellularis HM01]|nr:hypothetical protein RINTHM_9470 [Richelia intracellularis HM01]
MVRGVFPELLLIQDVYDMILALCSPVIQPINNVAIVNFCFLI